MIASDPSQTKAARPQPLPPLALSMGDPAGVGLDITLATWRRREELNLPAFALYADPRSISERAHQLGFKIEIAEVDSPREAAAVFETALPVRAVAVRERVSAGRPDRANAAAIISSIEIAAGDVATGRASALVTNPIAKATLYAAGFKHSGHTEFLAELASRFAPGRPWIPVMMLASDLLRVVPLTVHIPLAAVPSAITRDRLLTTGRITYAALRRDFGLSHPRLAVTGLNPHAGENGTIGREETEVIGPAVAELKAEGLVISGPYSADSLFHAAARSRYDAVIAMYHDQALIPLKALAFDTGVNATLGLPFVRTSPDHGTAFDIAGSGKASPMSLVAALKMAALMAQRRAEHRA